jgi:SAM-dependent methyltransferase
MVLSAPFGGFLPPLTPAPERELEYQAERAASIELHPTPDYIIDRYRQNRHWRVNPKEFLFKRLGDLSGKHVLDFGCGEGELSTQLAKLGAQVTGIDVSPALISAAERRAELDGVSSRTHFLVQDLAQTALPPATYDVIICFAVLHHVDTRSFTQMLLASLKPGGKIGIVEPIAFSPLLSKLRDIIPVKKDAGPFDHPLKRDEVTYIEGLLGTYETRYFRFIARLDVFLRNRNRTDRGHRLTRAMLVGMGHVDQFLVAGVPPLRRFFGNLVIVGEKRRS